MQAVFADITEAKQREEQLRHYYEDLQEMRKHSAELLGMKERLSHEIEEKKHADQALRERLAELQDKTKDLEEVNTALRILLSKTEAKKRDSVENVPASLKDRTVYIIGPRRLQNELIASCLEEAAVAQCVLGDDISRIMSPGNSNQNVWPGLVLLDCQGKDLRALLAELTVHLKVGLARNHLALFNVSRDHGIERKCVSEGMRGFFYEQDSLNIFLKGVRAIFAGQLWLSREIMARCILERGERDESPSRGKEILSPRQIEVLALVAVGARDGLIAERLCISPHTARTHVYNIFKKIKVTNRLDAALWAAKNL